MSYVPVLSSVQPEEEVLSICRALKTVGGTENSIWEVRCQCPHFAGKKTEAQRSNFPEMTRPVSGRASISHAFIKLGVYVKFEQGMNIFGEILREGSNLFEW